MGKVLECETVRGGFDELERRLTRREDKNLTRRGAGQEEVFGDRGTTGGVN